MICTDAQVRQMMKEREQGKTQQQAALKANVRSTKTVRKYERLKKLPSELKQVRTWRTRRDPFAQDWEQIEQMLEQLPGLEAKALFEWLQEQQPGRYAEGQLRTLQRRIEAWRALNQTQVASLAQRHRPGELMQTDGTWLTELGVTIAGQPFRHILIHCVLCYSNWEWGCIGQSESIVAIRQGVQAFLHKLGYAPRYHQTDNSTAATYVLRAPQNEQERRYHPLYLEMLQYYGMEPRLTHVGSPNENGDVESANGGLNRADGELFAAAGEINLPDYFAKPILIDEGSLRVSYKAEEDVVKIVDLNEGKHVERELMLVKVRAIGKDREELKRTVDIFRARIIDLNEKTYVIELTGTVEKLDAFLVAIDRALILETVRTGPCGLGRGEWIMKA